MGRNGSLNFNFNFFFEQQDRTSVGVRGHCAPLAPRMGPKEGGLSPTAPGGGLSTTACLAAPTTRAPLPARTNLFGNVRNADRCLRSMSRNVANCSRV
jgi:hypothetical protein